MKRAFALILCVCMLMGVAVFSGASAAVVDSSNPIEPYEPPGPSQSKSDDGSNVIITSDVDAYREYTKAEVNKATSNQSMSGKEAAKIVLNTITSSVQGLIDRVNSEKDKISEEADALNNKAIKIPIKITNVLELTPEIIQSILQASEQAAQSVKEASDGKVTVQAVVHADTVQGNKVIARLYIDPVAASKMNKTINPTVNTSSTSKEVKAIAKKFEKSLDKEVEVVQFGQTGGMPIQAAVKLDKLTNTEELTFFNFNIDTNKYSKVDVDYKFDKNGYAHINLDVGSNGGNIIIAGTGPRK